MAELQSIATVINCFALLLLAASVILELDGVGGNDVTEVKFATDGGAVRG